jgi:hypothetical protein
LPHCDLKVTFSGFPFTRGSRGDTRDGLRESGDRPKRCGSSLDQFAHQWIKLSRLRSLAQDGKGPQSQAPASTRNLWCCAGRDSGSHDRFPVFSLMITLGGLLVAEKVPSALGFLSEFPTRRNMELFCRNREFFEVTGNSIRLRCLAGLSPIDTSCDSGYCRTYDSGCCRMLFP